jgi:hypothetical protein
MDSELGETLLGDNIFDLENFTDEGLKFDIATFDLRY